VPAGESAVLLSNLYLAGNRLDEALQALDSALPRGGGEVSMFHQHRAHVYLLKIRKDSLAGRDVTDSLDRAQRSVDALVQLRRIGMALTIYLRLQGIRSSLLQRSGQSPEEISRKTVEYLDRLEAGLSTAEAWKEWALSCLGQAEGRALAADLLERSIRAAERALEKDPAITGMSGARGKARLKLSELKGRSVEERSRLLEAALQDLTAAVESRPRDSAAWQDLTSVRLSLVGIRRRAGEDAAEQIGEALTSAERSWALQPGGLETGLHRAHARLHAGDLGGSWADLHLVRELHGEASPMYRALRAALDRR
jgi:tetratricopeptide (TPR) repeat protein